MQISDHTYRHRRCHLHLMLLLLREMARMAEDWRRLSAHTAHHAVDAIVQLRLLLLHLLRRCVWR